jgi:hypothetical protein
MAGCTYSNICANLSANLPPELSGNMPASSDNMPALPRSQFRFVYRSSS